MAATHVLAAAVKTLAAVAQTLAERQPLPSPPRSGPETPMISVEDAEKQADKFRAEIAILTARVDALQAANRRTHYAAEREIQILKETHARECADLRAQLKTAWVGEREVLNQQRLSSTAENPSAEACRSADNTNKEDVSMEEEDEEDDSEYSDDEPDAEIEEEEASTGSRFLCRRLTRFSDDQYPTWSISLPHPEPHARCQSELR